MHKLVILCLVLCSGISAQKLFGYWDIKPPNGDIAPEDVPEEVNFVFDLVEPLNTSGILQCLNIFDVLYENYPYRLRGDYAARYMSFVQNATNLTCIYIGDELLWNGLPLSELKESLSVIDVPVFTNEAVDVVRYDVDRFGNSTGLTLIPTGIYLFAIDVYPPAVASIEEVKTIYRDHVYPKLYPHQVALYTPPGFVPKTNPSYEEILVNFTRDSIEWLCTDTRLSGLVPWHYKDLEVPGFEIGIENIPRVRDLYRSWADCQISASPTLLSQIPVLYIFLLFGICLVF